MLLRSSSARVSSFFELRTPFNVVLHEVFCTFLYYRCQFFKNNFNW
nr:MAG TPA: hypothetical protein [Caudoviricetes sp.]